MYSKYAWSSDDEHVLGHAVEERERARARPFAVPVGLFGWQTYTSFVRGADRGEQRVEVVAWSRSGTFRDSAPSFAASRT